MVLKNKLSKLNMSLSFGLVLFFASLPGILFGEEVYDGFQLFTWPAVASIGVMLIFHSASKNRIKDSLK